MKKEIDVVGAIIIDNQNNIFCARRKDIGKMALKWEFPGGKVELGETLKESLIREIKEELDLNITILNNFLTIRYEFALFTILFHTFICECQEMNYILNHHSEAKWLKKSELLELDWTELDLPIVRKLMWNE